MRPAARMKWAALLAAALASIGCVRSGQAELDGDGSREPEEELSRAGFDELDVSEDGELDAIELWRESLRHFERWDVDEDGRVTRAELDVATFESWDRDDDRRIDPEELEVGARQWLSRAEREWSRWDVDENGSLDRDEARHGLAESGLFDAFDADRDGAVTDAEVNGAWLTYWDTDRDRTIDALEWSMQDGRDRCIGYEPCASG